MKERGPWRTWIVYLLLAAGNIYIPVAECQSYSEGRARGDEGDAAALGFDGVLARHDGYVKGETPTIPQTSFSCSAQQYNPGLYADVETQCQVYHVCFEDRQESFLCGPGTNFNQRILACDFWYNFDCQNSPSFYNVNADIGKVSNTIGPGEGQGREPQQPSYPTYPGRPEQPPSVGSYPPRVSVPPPNRIQPQKPNVQQQPSQIPFEPQNPNYQPKPQPPRIQPQPPRIQPQPPRIQPQPPRIQPQPPRIQPQPPRNLPRPEPPKINVKPQYPPSPSGQGNRVTYPPRPNQPSIQQEVDTGGEFNGFKPHQPASLPPPPPPRPQTPIPVFPPVVSPPRVSRPPLTPPFGRQPEGSISRPSVPVAQPGYHPDSNLKGNVDYRPQQPRPQQPPQQPRIPQPSRPVGYPSYPVTARPVVPRPVPQKPVGKPYQPPQTIQQEHIETDYIPSPRPIQQDVVISKPPSRPYVPPPPPPRPIQQEVTHVKPPPSRPYVPPPPPPSRPIQQEVTNIRPPQPPSRPYVPPPPPPRPVQQEITHIKPPPSRPYVPSPPPPRPIQQEVTNVKPPPSRPYIPPPPLRPVQQEVIKTKPTPRPSRPYVPPPQPQVPIETDFGRQPPVAPSVINEQQKPAGRPSNRPQVSEGFRPPQPPQRPKPVFPPPSDHPNANIKGGPGYQQPPPQIPRFEPTRIGRPSSPQGVRPKPDASISGVKPAGGSRPSVSTSGGYKVPQPERIKKPSEPPKAIYQPPIQVVDHPRSEIKGSGYDGTESQQPQRTKSPTSVSGVKRPQPQRSRAPVVVSRPQPPSLPSTKTTNRIDNQVYERRPQPPAPGRVKIPSQSQVQTVSRPSCSGGSSQPGCPSPRPIDHPNANIKGGSGFNQPYPVNPPSAPSTSYEQKTAGSRNRQPSGSGRGGGCNQGYSCGSQGGQQINQQPFQPQRQQQIKTSIKTRPQSASQSIISKQPKPDYGDGSSYTRGPDVYPKPEFGQPNAPYQPISTPSRSSQRTKQGSSPQNSITHADNKPAYQGSPAASGFGTQVQPDYPFRQVPGHQPPNQPQVFPHRENPDHPNESIKGSGAYRPPPPAGFQASASEVQLQKAVPEPEPEPEATKLLGDIGAE